MSTFCYLSSSNSNNKHTNNESDDNNDDDDPVVRALETAPLAFSSDPSLVSATSRIVVPTLINERTTTSWINVEIFEPTEGATTTTCTATTPPTTTSSQDESQRGGGSTSSSSTVSGLCQQSRPLVIYIPGICESAETRTVQEMAIWAKTIGVRLAVIELPGHGLSRTTTTSSSSLLELPHEDVLVVVKQVLEVIQRILKVLMGTGADSSSYDNNNNNHTSSSSSSSSSLKIPYVLSGSSFGATVALYAAEYISRRIQWWLKTTSDEQQQQQQDDPSDPTIPPIPPVPIPPLKDERRRKQEESIIDDEILWKDFFMTSGTLAAVVGVSPAVGIDPLALPPSWIVSTLSFASAILPSARPPFTPYEDSSQYDCPTNTTRNYTGRWPLAISKFLLDLTSDIVPKDVMEGRLTLRSIPKVILMGGAKDVLIPIESIRTFEANIQSPNKKIIILPRVGHDVLTNKKSSSKALETLFGALFE